MAIRAPDGANNKLWVKILRPLLALYCGYIFDHKKRYVRWYVRLPHLEVIFHLRIEQQKNFQIIPNMIKAE